MTDTSAKRPVGDPILRRVQRSRFLPGLGSSGNRPIVLAEFALILLVWQWVSGVARLVNPTFLPPPAEIVSGLVRLVSAGEIWAHLVPSVAAWSIGYVLAILVGVPLGIMLGGSRPFHRLAGPVLWSLYATPWLAYQPLSKVWFGFGLQPVIFLVFIAAVFPTMLNTAAGVGTTRQSLLDAGRVFGASRLTALRKIVLPSSLPLALAGMRQSVAMATIALIVAEMDGPSVGIGTLIILKAQSRTMNESFAGILIAVLWTLAISYLVKYLGDRIAPWQVDARQK